MAPKLTHADREKIVGLYEGRHRENGRDIKTVGWGSVEDQLLRFDMLVRGLDIEGKRILDVGCGLGDLVPYLDALSAGEYSYVGVDITRALVEDAKYEFGGPQRDFIVGDILEMDDLPKFDIVLLSGALNFRVANNQEHAQSMIKCMYGLCSEAVSFNLLSSYVDFETEKNFHHVPEDILLYSKTLTRWVNIIHDYPLYEFTTQLFRQSYQRAD